MVKVFQITVPFQTAVTFMFWWFSGKYSKNMHTIKYANGTRYHPLARYLNPAPALLQ